MPYYIRIQDDGNPEVREYESATLDVPSHLGKIWLDGNLICLQFPPIHHVSVEGHPPLQIGSYTVRIPAAENGITSAEAVLLIRQKNVARG